MHKKIFVLLAYVCFLLLVGCGAPKIIDDADEVNVTYTFTFSDGEIYDRGTTTLTIGAEQDLFTNFHKILLGKQEHNVLTGTLSPAFTYGDLYNPALKQKLAEIYFTAMGNTPAVGDAIFFDNIGTGIILATDREEGIKKYTIDFNPRETYEPLQYEVKVISIEKK